MSARIVNGNLVIERVIGTQRITNCVGIDADRPMEIPFTDLRERQRDQVDNAEWSAQDYIDNAG